MFIHFYLSIGHHLTIILFPIIVLFFNHKVVFLLQEYTCMSKRFNYFWNFFYMCFFYVLFTLHSFVKYDVKYELYIWFSFWYHLIVILSITNILLYYFLLCGLPSYTRFARLSSFCRVSDSVSVPLNLRPHPAVIRGIGFHSEGIHERVKPDQTVIILNSVNPAPAPRQPSRSYFLNADCTDLPLRRV